MARKSVTKFCANNKQFRIAQPHCYHHQIVVNHQRATSLPKFQLLKFCSEAHCSSSFPPRLLNMASTIATLPTAESGTQTRHIATGAGESSGTQTPTADTADTGTQPDPEPETRRGSGDSTAAAAGFVVVQKPPTAPAHDEHQYLQLIEHILATGNRRPDRTGTGTVSVFGAQMRFQLGGGRIPVLTTKRVAWRVVAEELLWFIRGSTDAAELQAKNVRIWDGNSSRAFLDKCGFEGRKEGDLGPVYGFQWRYCGAEYKTCKDAYVGQGIDQLQDCIRRIRETPHDRRIIMCAWNPVDIPQMALPPCHCLVQFYVADGRLSCQMYQRSADMGLGVPFNIASYALLTHMIAHVCGLEAGEFIHTLGDAHVYNTHVEPLREQLRREPKAFPTLRFARKVAEIDDFRMEDIVLEGYEPHPTIKMEMAI